MNDPTKALAEDVTSFCEQRFTDVSSIAGLAKGPLSVPEPRRSGLAIGPENNDPPTQVSAVRCFISWN